MMSTERNFLCFFLGDSKDKHPDFLSTPHRNFVGVEVPAVSGVGLGGGANDIGIHQEIRCGSAYKLQHQDQGNHHKPLSHSLSLYPQSQRNNADGSYAATIIGKETVRFNPLQPKSVQIAQLSVDHAIVDVVEIVDPNHQFPICHLSRKPLHFIPT